MPEEQAINLSEPLQDIQEMVEERPRLTQEEWEVVGKATPWLKATLKPEVRTELEVEYSKKMEEGLNLIKISNKEEIDKQFEALKKAQEPLSQDDLNKLLSQEYVEFAVKLRFSDPDDNSKRVERNFTICELPSAVEERFYKVLRNALIPILQERESISFKLDKGSLIEKIQIVLEASDKALDLGNQLVSIVLDPWSKDKTITKDFVRNNISVERQAAIILAQFEANKYRDFFSQGFQSFLKLRR